MAHHVVLPGYAPRSLMTLALGLATTPRGACHNRSGAYDTDLDDTTTHASGHAEQAARAAESEDFAAVMASLTICKFIRRCVEAANLYQLATGLPMTGDDLRLVGTRITTLKRLFNMRQDWTRSDDRLPARLLDEPRMRESDDQHPLDRAELDALIDAYYVMRGAVGRVD